MATESLGGSLIFTAGIEFEDAGKTAAKMEQQLQSAAKKAADTGKKINDAFLGVKNTTINIDTSDLDSLTKKISQLEKEEQRFKTALGGTTDLGLISDYTKGLERVQGELRELYPLMDGLQAKSIIGDADVEVKEVEKVKTAFQELRQLKKDLAAADPNDTAAIDAMLERAGELDDKMGDVQAAIRLAGSDTAGIDAMVQGVRGAVGGFAALQGAIALVTDEEDDFAKTTAKMTAVLGVLNGVQEVAAVLDKNSALNLFLQAQYRKLAATNTAQHAVATTAATAAQGANAVATSAASASTWSLNAAMAANPAGALILAITAVIGVMQLLSDDTEDVLEKQVELNDAMAKAQDVINDLARSYASLYSERATEAENAVALAQAEGKSENQILSLKQKAAQAKKEESLNILANLGYVGATTSEIRQQVNLKAVELQMAKEKLKAQLLNNAADEDAIKLLESKIKLLESEFTGANDAFQQLTQSDSDKAELAAEAARKAREDAFKSATAEAEARLIQSLKNTKEELEAQKAAIRARTREELSNVNLTAGERKKILAQEKDDLAEADRKYQTLLLNNQKSLLQARLSQIKEGSQEELDLKNQLLQKNAELELQQEGITAARKKEIHAALDKAIAENKRQYYFQQAKDNRQTDIEDIEARLATVLQGSVKELNLKRDLISQKEGLDIIAAQQSIKNEALLQATILSISKKAQKERRQLGADFVNYQIEQNAKLLQQQTDLANLPLENVTADPMASARKKAEAQQQINKNIRESLVKQLKEIDGAIVKTTLFGADGDLNKLLDKRVEIYKQIYKLTGLIASTEKKKLSDDMENVAKWVGVAGSAAGDLASAFEGVNSEVAKLMSDLNTVANIAGNAASATAKFASGDIAGGIQGVVAVISSVLTLAKKVKESRRLALEEVDQFNQKILSGEIEITQQYRERQREQAALNKLKLEGIEAERRLLEEQRKAAAQQENSLLAELQNQSFVSGMTTKKDKGLLGTGIAKKTKAVEINEALAGKTFEQIEQLYIKGQLTGKAKEIFEALQKIKQEGADINAMLEENKRAAQEVFTGTTSDSIVDSIADGFKSGLSTAADFAGSFEELMRNALINSLKYKYLEGPLKEFYEQFSKEAEDDGQLTEAEIAELQTMFDNIIGTANAQFTQLQQIAGMNLGGSNEANSLKGAIKGMTEGQAELLSGQFGGLRITALQQLQIASQSLSVHQRIETNTANTVLELQNGFKAMVQLMKIEGIKLK